MKLSGLLICQLIITLMCMNKAVASNLQYLFLINNDLLQLIGYVFKIVSTCVLLLKYAYLAATLPLPPITLDYNNMVLIEDKNVSFGLPFLPNMLQV